MRERFEQQMEILHTELIELGALCEQAIGRTYEVLLEGNQRAAEEIIEKRPGCRCERTGDRGSLLPHHFTAAAGST